MGSVLLAVEANMDLFIGEVKKYPAIWDIKSESYGDRNKKRSAWISVCKEFCEQFEAKEDKEKNEICDALSKKWKNLKDAYSKSLKKRESGSGRTKRQYIFAKQLSFLNQVTKIPTESSFSKQPEVVANDDDDDDDDDGARVDANIDEPSPADDFGASQSNSSPVPPSSANKKNPNSKKRKRDSMVNFMNSPLPANNTVQPFERNQHQSFFDSLIPVLNKFTDDEVMDFRMGVLQLVKEVLQQRTRRNLAHSTSGSAQDLHCDVPQNRMEPFNTTGNYPLLSSVPPDSPVSSVRHQQSSNYVPPRLSYTDLRPNNHQSAPLTNHALIPPGFLASSFPSEQIGEESFGHVRIKSEPDSTDGASSKSSVTPPRTLSTDSEDYGDR